MTFLPEFVLYQVSEVSISLHKKITTMNMNNESISATIIALEKSALEAWNNGDPTPYLNLYDPFITYFDPFFDKRLDGIEALTSYYSELGGTVKVDSYEMIDPIVESVNDMAVLTFNLISYYNGSDSRWNCTEVYKRNDSDQWKIVHNHWSLTKPTIG